MGILSASWAVLGWFVLLVYIELVEQFLCSNCLSDGIGGATYLEWYI